MKHQSSSRLHPTVVLMISLTFAMAMAAGEGAERSPKLTRTTVVHGTDFTVYQTVKVKVFFSSTFLDGFVGDENAGEYKRCFMKVFDPLFRTGQLTGEMFYEEIGDLPSGVINMSKEDWKRLNSAGGVYEALRQNIGPLIKILYFFPSEIQPAQKNRKSYEFWVTNSATETGWGAFDKFCITIETRWLHKPVVVSFKYLGMEL
ncbi:MAG TPA: hypothetical protein PLN27_17710 [Acidobacteriota bacterium]|nr:hypothetical protein [Acidobacteriota bacterium]